MGMATSTGPAAGTDPGYVDWDFAKATGRRLVPAGPRVSPAEAVAAVAALRDAAQRSRQPVADTARLHAPAGDAALVVDRPGWIDANVDSLRGMLTPVVQAMASRRSGPSSATVATVGGKVTGGETGALMSFLATKVLGQYDLAPDGTPRLLLIAPNVVQAEAELGVDPADFRLWVCLHEETHRVQFTAVPWLRQHLIDRARELSLDLMPDPDQLGARLEQLVQNLPQAFRAGGTGLTELMTTQEQRDKIAALTAVMSLLEGHADVVMDDVGPQVVPTVEQIRVKFQRRREGAGSIDRLLRRLLGLEAKMRQYRDGATFVRAVTDRVGLDGFNAVWSSPETLPRPAEIEDPQAWVTRVHG
ncbi:zinc-dependent metalloprotease [Oryzihumus sp.]|uniref:zinc-dependent metalloprotease n=1 Tax=Oryzihumus sp. TaxID=1968903 RepID=UPI002ED8FE43